jgi:hypothetical protein
LKAPSSNLELDAGEIVRTVERLHDRITERFPESGLGAIARDLVHVARVTVPRTQLVNRPHIPLRLATGLIVALIIALLVQLVASSLARGLGDLQQFGQLVQTLESALNDLFLIGAALFFLVTVETRLRRRRALRFLRELRALAHIVDMHQLTKDPERLAYEGRETASSPRESLSPFEMSRYLDYCSEMLSLISKIAALYVQNFDDPVVLAAVDEVETLTTGQSRKIWQKIMIITRG